MSKGTNIINKITDKELVSSDLLNEDNSYKIVCCSEECVRKNECSKHAINNTGLHICENYYSFGYGSLGTNISETKYQCGEQGNWGMFKPISSPE